MSTSYTPGPWQVMTDYDGATIIIANIDGEIFTDGTSTFSYDFVCDTFSDYSDDSKLLETAKADARLIAAAPELLEALASLLAFVEAHTANNEVIPPHTVEHVRARAAIAKAVQS